MDARQRPRIAHLGWCSCSDKCTVCVVVTREGKRTLRKRLALHSHSIAEWRAVASGHVTTTCKNHTHSVERCMMAMMSVRGEGASV